MTDEYSLFYLQFIEKNAHEKDEIWHSLSQTQEYKIWCGFAFENICLKHISQIKKALSIGGVYSSSSTFSKKGTKSETGTQIDLVLDRKDQVINLFEIKFYNTEFTMTKAYADQLRERLRLFTRLSKTRNQVVMTMITTFGLKGNRHSLGLVEQVLNLEDLFY